MSSKGRSLDIFDSETKKLTSSSLPVLLRGLLVLDLECNETAAPLNRNHSQNRPQPKRSVAWVNCEKCQAQTVAELIIRVKEFTRARSMKSTIGAPWSCSRNWNQNSPTRFGLTQN